MGGVALVPRQLIKRLQAWALVAFPPNFVMIDRGAYLDKVRDMVRTGAYDSI